ncbi:MAG: MobC family plasmid mobilization relaxosome protein [Proteobacteria bacterium]|nr:MobC family plasmid mobilization relaxosome protein [Pseudomonadota bacterium]
MAESKLKRIQFRVTPEEHALILERIEASGLTMSALFRDHLGRVKIRNREDEKRRHAVLNRVNANLNQVAKWANTHKSGADAFRVCAMLMDVKDTVDRLVYEMEKEDG